ncbi:MAG: Acetyl-coenzyme A synthetase [Actinobacteria bacterium ADurb.Bin444]|nr:MAG: Acetyl-coenzyme A synthetase [Actinobacteria bacterium ADurb.Bin444]
MRKTTKWVVADANQEDVFWPSEAMKQHAWLSDASTYEQADKDPVAFWEERAREGLHWFKEWDTAYKQEPPYFQWFVGGKLNASYNCLDRHVESWRRNKAAIIGVREPIDEPPTTLTYFDLYREVNKFANVLKGLGLRRGDRVSIHLPMIPEAQIAMLACARLGIPHSVVFSAFAPDSLRSRILDAGSKVLVTCDGYFRRGRAVNLKSNADDAVQGTDVNDVIVFRRTGQDVNWVEGRDHWWHELMAEADSYCEPEVMDSEDLLYILYTSGTTGKPKGVIHTTGGHLVQAYWTTKWDFDLHDDDVFWCTADIGWVTGHTYNVYGPLSVGATQIFYEGAPDFPDQGRVWEIIEKYGVTVFYTAPTLIRMFAGWGDEWPDKHDLTSLRLLATVGEPINRDAWMWFFDKIGGGRCPIIDTWWQTETGGTLINALPGIGPFIPTVAGRSFPGTRHQVVDEQGKPLGVGEGGLLVQKSPFGPGMLRGVYGDPAMYKDNYWTEYGLETYYTGDGARLYIENNFRITGRVDDVMKVAGHRLSSAEVEDAVCGHPQVAECAVVAAPHDIKGATPYAFVRLSEGEPSDDLAKEIIAHVVKALGPTCRPEKVLFADALPRTRSGKIMRRILQRLVRDEPIGDTVTIENPESVEALKKLVGYKDSG